MSAAYIGEIFRSGIQSVDKGQLEAIARPGLRLRPSMRLVVVPQGIRRVLPALVNQFICPDQGFLPGLYARPRWPRNAKSSRSARTPRPTAATFRRTWRPPAFYLVLTVPLTHFVNWIDSRLRTGRPEKKEPDEAAAVVGKGAQA